MEKDNKKIRDAAKKKRNETVRVIRIIMVHVLIRFHSNWWPMCAKETKELLSIGSVFK